ncbi:uncharacterized protein LOC117328039 [Pecten maximus]|uniref:uncharacterized protein LOC117328039 n=1 Tax=Pecten maximus TaxID=6579 RepID=UPI0014582AEB|nr:uncharacterized protein LOC117328039 [Pecten maximus]
MTPQNGKDPDLNPIVSQPQSVPAHPGTNLTVPFHIRCLRDDPDDAAFAGRLTVNAFRSKYVHATSEGSIPDVIRTVSMDQRGQDPVYYERNLVAEYDGKPVGIIYLIFRGDPLPRENTAALDTFGCCDVCGLKCLTYGLQTVENIGDQECYLDMVAVEEEFRGKGIGKALLDRADHEARIHGCQTISLLVGVNNWAIRLYERQGYRVTSRSWKCGWLWCTLGVCCFLKMEKRLD